MTVRASRLLSALTAGGVLAGSLLLASGAAEANPRPPGGGTVPATCGQTVTAYPGDRVKVTPKLGVPFVQTATPGMGPVSMTVSGLLCSVQVKVLKPVSTGLTRMAPPVGSLTTSVTEQSGAILTPQSTDETAAPSLVPAPRAAAPRTQAPTMLPGRAPASSLPSQAPLATLPAGDLAASAPAYAPTFSEGLPSSFLSSGTAAPGARLDAGSLFGSAFPGMRAGAPAYMGYDPTSAVTTASQVQALPVEGLSDGVGIPAILAVLGLSGAAAFAVRRMVLGKSLVPAGLVGGAAPLAAVPAAPAPAEVPAEVPAERTAFVGVPAESAAERTAFVDVPAEVPAERTAFVGVPAESAVEQTALVGPPVPDAADAAEATAVTPAVDDLDQDHDGVEQDLDPAEVTGVLEPAASR